MTIYMKVTKDRYSLPGSSGRLSERAGGAVWGAERRNK